MLEIDSTLLINHDDGDVAEFKEIAARVAAAERKSIPLDSVAQRRLSGIQSFVKVIRLTHAANCTSRRC